jgi:hypothetical protein
MPKAMVAAQPRSSSAGFGGDVGDRHFQRQIEYLEA